jgi:CRISPR-associated protein Cst2
VSLLPWAGDITFNAASVGATASASRTGNDPVPYAAEIHATRYQYGLALTPEDLEDKQRALLTLDAVLNLHDVAGNHGRFLYDFAPDAVAFRWTDDFAPRMLYAFELEDQEKERALAAPELVRRVEAGDIDPAELVVGGSLSGTSSGQALAAQGATVLPGVKAAFGEIRRRVAADLGLAS